ncbi:MAG: HAD family hydrolase [Oscillospiraceae bacterium]|nr:HAD family hydrolase [Oscillospiraceae bacterium]
MKELCYPFDSAYIIKKKRSIKKALLADGSQRIEKRIAVLGGSTTGDIVATLELFLLDNGIQPAFYESEYNAYWQDAMFGNEELDSFKPDVIFIHTSNRNITETLSMVMTREQVDEALDRQLEHFTVMWKKLSEKFGCAIIQNNFELPLYRLLGNRDAYDFHGMTSFISRLNEKFCEYARDNKNFYISDINYLSASYGLEKWSNPLYWYMYKYALCLEAVPYLSHSVANIIKSLYGKNKKAFALDLDNTLWGGIVGDDGVDNLALGEETATAQAYREFQLYVKKHKELGVMLSVCSKNEEENAIAGLNHPDGWLRPDDFVNIKANWDPKDRNISAIASEINILPESMVFVDDNPAERAIVAGQLPGVAVPEMDTVENYIRTIDRNGYFEVTSFSEDDLKRNEMYIANAKRAKQQASFENYEDYLLSLQMSAQICDFEPVYIDRITQLTNKSNQFNLTTKRYTPAQMQEVYESDSYIRLFGKLSDKFGDNGVVSVVIGKKQDNELHIDLWLMSCRVLKRDMEYAMLDRLAEESKKQGITKLKGYYYPTAKNKMVKNLYSDFGFEKLSEDEQGNAVYELDISGYERKCKVIEF